MCVYVINAAALECVCAFVCIIDDILDLMMDDKTAIDNRKLKGHSGAVYGLSFSPDKTLLLSCSEDGTGNISSLKNALTNILSFTHTTHTHTCIDK